MSDFASLGLSQAMLRSLEHSNFTQATPIQREAIPHMLANRDMIGVAQTGSGKTAAFVIPLLERLAQYEVRAEPNMPRALILAPTRELALQTTDRIKELSVGMKASCCTIYGGAPYRTQTHILRRGVDILISTPGRLLDHIKRGNVFLDAVEYFVLDEADRMLDLGFVDDVRKINSKIIKEHQSVMFSATLNEAIQDLKSTLLNDPVQIEVAMSATVADNLDHWVMHVPGHQKKDLLAYLIETEEPEKSIVFVRTRRDADEISDYLTGLGLKAEAIHGDKAQKLRQRTISGFRSGLFDFLVATDVAARGIDVKDISHVFNFDVPVEAESYVHRIGRTARGGASGRAFTLCGKNEPRLLRAIEDMLGEQLEVVHDHPFRLIAPKKPSIAARKRPSVAARKGGGKTIPKKAKGKRAEFFGEVPKKAGPKKPGKNKGKPKFARSEEHTDARPAKAARPARPSRSDGKPTHAGKRSSGAGVSTGSAGRPARPDRTGPAGRPAKSFRPGQKTGQKTGQKAGAKPAGRSNRPHKVGGNQPMKRR